MMAIVAKGDAMNTDDLKRVFASERGAAWTHAAAGVWSHLSDGESRRAANAQPLAPQASRRWTLWCPPWAACLTRSWTPRCGHPAPLGCALTCHSLVARLDGGGPRRAVWDARRVPPPPPPPPPQGNINVMKEAIAKGVKKFVLVTSLGCGDSKATIGPQARAPTCVTHARMTHMSP